MLEGLSFKFESLKHVTGLIPRGLDKGRR